LEALGQARVLDLGVRAQAHISEAWGQVRRSVTVTGIITNETDERGLLLTGVLLRTGALLPTGVRLNAGMRLNTTSKMLVL
jgi:hypothetical protein